MRLSLVGLRGFQLFIQKHLFVNHIFYSLLASNGAQKHKPRKKTSKCFQNVMTKVLRKFLKKGLLLTREQEGAVLEGRREEVLEMWLLLETTEIDWMGKMQSTFQTNDLQVNFWTTICSKTGSHLCKCCHAAALFLGKKLILGSPNVT